MSLVAAELEQRGISTVVIQLLRLATEKVRPPRALVVPYRHGYPLGSANDPEKQRSVISAALNLLTNPGLKPPAIVDFKGQMAEDG